MTFVLVNSIIILIVIPILIVIVLFIFIPIVIPILILMVRLCRSQLLHRRRDLSHFSSAQLQLALPAGDHQHDFYDDFHHGCHHDFFHDCKEDCHEDFHHDFSEFLLSLSHFKKRKNFEKNAENTNKLDRVNCADSAFIIFELLYNCFKNMPHVFFLSLRCMLCICVFVYLHFCICLFDIWEYHL